MRKQRSGRMKRRKRTTSDDLLFQPWFLSKEIAQAIRVLIPPGYHRKMRDYFDTYGCLRCNRGDIVYHANGMCHSCSNMTRIRLRKCVQRRLEGSGDIVTAKLFLGKPGKARKLLQGVSHGDHVGKRRPRNLGVNPAVEAYNSLIDVEHLPSTTNIEPLLPKETEAISMTSRLPTLKSPFD